MADESPEIKESEGRSVSLSITRNIMIQILIRNEGNRLTPEMIQGIIVAFNQNLGNAPPMKPAPDPPAPPAREG